MGRVKLVGLLAMAAMLVATAAGAGTLPPGNRNPAYLNGTFGFQFNGASENEFHSISGVGTITFDGRGNVVAGGIIRCNDLVSPAQFNSPITGGSYSLNTDGSGYVTINAGGYVCDEDLGVDLNINVVNGGVRCCSPPTAVTISTTPG